MMHFDDLRDENQEFNGEDILEDEYATKLKRTDELLLAYSMYDEEYIVYHELEISDGESKEEYSVKVFQSKELSDCVLFIYKFYEKEEDW
jgi:hypothetical protein